LGGDEYAVSHVLLNKFGLPSDRKIGLLPFVNCGLRNYAMVLALFFPNAI